VDPPINKTAWGRADPIPLHVPPSLSLPLPLLSLSRAHRRDLATAMLPRPSIQPSAPAKLVLAPSLCITILLRMRVKTLCHIRSNINPSGEMAAEGASIPDPQAAWVRSMMTEAKIQALVEHGLVEGCRRGTVPERGRQGAGRLHLLLRVRLQPPSGTSSAGCCTTTVWSWYTSFPTPFP
jgi:hypothetical protein